MNSLQLFAQASGLLLAPICAAGLALANRRWVSLGLLLGVFAGAALVLVAGQQDRIGAGLLLTGTLCCAILAVGFRRSDWRPVARAQESIPGGRGFRLAVVFLVGTAAWGVSASAAPGQIPVPPARLTAAALVFAMGLVQLGLSQEHGAVALGLLTTVAGFEMFYTALEPSLALRAVLAAIMLGIAFVTSILLELPAEVVADDRRRG